MSVPLRVLCIEDSPVDAELVMHELASGGYEITSLRVDTAESMQAALDTQTWDLVLSDFSMPNFSGTAALGLLRRRDPDTPFIIVSGTIGEEIAVAALRGGANDFLVKGRLSRLVPAVNRELREVRARRERRHLEERLRHVQKLESLGQLAGGIAHDFNNVLTAILGFADMLLEAELGAHRHELMQIKNAAESGRRLTRQLLAFSRQQRVEPAPLALNGVVSQIGGILERLVGERVAVKTHLTATGLVWADTGQVEQVLVNLATNARDAMPHGGDFAIETADARVSDSVAAREQVRAGDYILLTVSDTGAGMSPDTQARIFEPFFTTKAPGHGTGFGLATVYGIVRQSNGFVEVSSTIGQGTTFRVYLPRLD